LLEPVLVPDLDRVAKALGGQERGLRTLAFDQRVGRQGRAVDDDRKIGRRERGFAQYALDRLDYGTLGRLGGGQDLDAVAPPICFERDIGKSAADVDTQSATRRHHRSPRVRRR